MTQSTKKKLSVLDTLTNKATTWVGSTASIIAHTVFFVIIFVLILFGVSLDTVLLVLTTVVSLEAIYLAIFIQRSVNLQSETIAGEFDELEEAISEDIDETEAALMKDLDVTEKNISEDIDETEEALKKDHDETEKHIAEDIDETERGIISKAPQSTEALAQELRKIVREEIDRALKN